MSTEAQRKKHADYMRKWYASRPGYAAMQYQRNKSKDPEYYKKRIKKWRTENPDLVKAQKRRYRIKYRAKVLAGKRADYLRNKVRRGAQMKAWTAKNRVKVRILQKAWRQRNPQQHTEGEMRRRARKAAATVEDCTKRVTILRRNRFCHWCCEFMPPGTATIDHVIPLSRGGKHCNDNLVAACLTCNSSKGTKLLHEWRAFKEAA